MSSGFDIAESVLESTFGTCDVDSDGQINQDEIHQENCVGTLDTMFGLTESQLPELFNLTDTNADMKISSEEALTAFDRLDRILGSPERVETWEVWRGDHFSVKEQREAENIALACYTKYENDMNRISCVRKKMLEDIESIKGWKIAICFHYKQNQGGFTVKNNHPGEYKRVYLRKRAGEFDINCFFHE